MKMKKVEDFIRHIIESQKSGVPKGIYSVCTYNRYVLESAFQRAVKDKSEVLIESTCNQVNQYGGYTGMKPKDFKEYIYSIAKEYNFTKDRIILGGDHLGPFPFREEPADVAMVKAEEMVKEYVLSGYKKIHLDTSMGLKGDSEPLDSEIIARRCAELCYVAEEAYKRIGGEKVGFEPPIYIIGTEVPAPGGSDEVEEGVTITRVSDLEETIAMTKKYFNEKGLEEAWERVVAVVVQPGVEHGDHTIIEYDRNKARELSTVIKKYRNLVYEGHATDYQTGKALREMVEDGIAILKVGPSLTYAVREAIFLLSYIEEELFKGKREVILSRIVEVLDEAMRRNPKYWDKYYNGDEDAIKFKRKYSFFDRVRYYWVDKDVKESLKVLIENLRGIEIPLSLISQFFPKQYEKVREGKIEADPESLIRGRVMDILKKYSYAIGMCKI